MPLPNSNKEYISIQIIKVLYKAFKKFPDASTGNRNAPFHTAFLDAFRDKFQEHIQEIPFFVSLTSWLQGLNTGLGQTFFERVANNLSGGQKMEFTSGNSQSLDLYDSQRQNIISITNELATGKSLPNLKLEDQKIFISGKDLEKAIDFSADVFINDDKNVTAIELKSVRPNKGEMQGEKRKVLEGKAALFTKYPDKEVRFFIGFPFDPTNESNNPCGYNKDRFLKTLIKMKTFFDPNEVLLASELWDFLSGQRNTMQDLLELINSIARPDFIEKLDFINDHSNKERMPEQYEKILNEWNLFSEIELFSQNQELKKNLKSKKDTRIYNQLIFTTDSKHNLQYNSNRNAQLKQIISHGS